MNAGPNADPLREALARVTVGETLTRELARAAFERALGRLDDPSTACALAGLVAALATRGEAPSEVAGCADALRAAMTPFEHDHTDAIDTCGTGGDGLGTFNLSTAAAIVCAAAGAVVVKHGNRAASSRCGSADLLEAAGLPLELAPDAARRVLDRTGITYLHAPLYHGALRAAAPLRRALGVRTVFNLVGPLANPGRVRRQIVGVGRPEHVAMLAEALAELGHARAYVVHGAGGADELTLAGANRVAAVGDAPDANGENGSRGDFDAEALALAAAPVSALAGGDVQHNLALLAGVLDGTASRALRDAVALNAGCALVVAGLARDARGGVAKAAGVLADGAARAKLAQWIAAAREEAAR